jgi:diketogulonate reductase-like aldo/keto reductase
MEYKELSASVKIPVLGIGTWKMGGGMTADKTYDKENIIAIKTAIELGMTHIDTAELYGNGHAEELVGAAIQGVDREKLFITTKVKWENLKYNDVIAAAKRSLRRLGTGFIDLYLVHVPNPSIPIKETMKAMDYLVDNGFTRFIGVSNFSVEQIKEAQKNSRSKIIANQIEYNLLARNEGEHTKDMESKIIPYCQKNGIIVTSYRPLGKGELAKPGLKLLDELAEKYGKTQAQIALNWLISKPSIIAIPKAAKTEHLKENLGALGWRLSLEDMLKLDEEFPGKE